MLLHIAVAIDDGDLGSELMRLLQRRDTIVEPVPNPREFWKGITGRASDLLVVSRPLVSESSLEESIHLRKSGYAPAIVVLSDHENDEDRAALLAAGCEAVLNTSVATAKLQAALNAILDRRRERILGNISIPRQPVRTEISDFVARSPEMKKLLKVLPRVAKSNSAVLILGETGVGKERLAHALHSESPRRDGPFVAIHCGALPESLLESELFGHEQGAFTGATKSRRGCFELAHMGTIFLDEIGEMPLHMQSKLLRVLEDHQIRRVGSEKSVRVDVRVMAATNRNLEEEARAKRFRRDLFYRLNVVSLTVPPLRQRVEDIPELTKSYIDYLGARIGCPASSIDKDALDALCRYQWPGNVRELINVVERGLLLCENEVITLDDLPIIRSESGPSTSKREEVGESWPRKLMDIPLKQARSEVLRNFEIDYLTRLLTATGGRVGQAAKKAGIDSRSLFDKMKEYGLRKEDFR